MKKLIIILIVISGIAGKSKSQNEPTIFVNMKNNVYLFFPSPIKQGISGSESAVFVYNTKKKDNIGILKGNPGCNTNLLIITDDGSIYSFLIKYKKDINKFNYFIDTDSSINNLNDIRNKKRKNTSVSAEENSKYDNSPITENVYDTVGIYGKDKTRPEKIFKKNCKEVINDGNYFRRFSDINSNVILRLKNLEYKDNYYYFYFEINNNTNVDYDINFIEFYLSTKKKKLRSSAQKIMYKPDYVYNKNTRIKGKSKEEFIYVIKKFTVSDNKVLIIDVNELKGERNLHLEINSEIINNPN